jgi:hypothetical protein
MITKIDHAWCHGAGFTFRLIQAAAAEGRRSLVTLHLNVRSGQRSLQVHGERLDGNGFPRFTDASGSAMSSRRSRGSLGLRKATVRPSLTPGTASKSGRDQPGHSGEVARCVDQSTRSRRANKRNVSPLRWPRSSLTSFIGAAGRFFPKAVTKFGLSLLLTW